MSSVSPRCKVEMFRGYSGDVQWRFTVEEMYEMVLGSRLERYEMFGRDVKSRCSEGSLHGCPWLENPHVFGMRKGRANIMN
eukprot:scaffold45834_cov64-Attheya_sp.AAC.2